ncbi:MAG: type II toxin-antitoxin system HicA family toxin [Chloroflexi bacterium]|nr:type II toxin-antitoxin system HicA family toxin [Chloroflexota bacterium]
MPRFPVVSGREVVRALERIGFTQIDQEGSHVKLRRLSEDRTLTVIVPLHPELARKTLSSILKQARLTVDNLTRYL